AGIPHTGRGLRYKRYRSGRRQDVGYPAGRPSGTMKFDILTLFPAMFAGPFDESIIRRAREKQLIDISLHNIRDFAVDRHQTADDAPYGGGAGMVMKVEPLAACIESVKAKSPESTVVMTSPQGRRFTHKVAAELSTRKGLIIVCGRYEGIDERIRELFVE